MDHLTKYQRVVHCEAGRSWFSEMWVIENMGPNVLSKMKSDTEMVQGVTHKLFKRQVWSTTGELESRDEWCFCKEVVDLVRKELAYERLKRREGR